MKSLRLLIMGLLLLLWGCSSVKTNHPFPDNEGQVMWNLPEILNGHFEIGNLPEELKDTLGQRMLEFRQVDPTHLLLYTYISFTKKDLKKKPEYTLKDNILKGEGKEFTVKKINGRLAYDMFLQYELDLEKNILTMHYDNEKNKTEEYHFLLKEYDNVLFLSIFRLDSQKVWDILLMEPTEGGITFKYIDIENLEANSRYYTDLLGPIEKTSDYATIINPPDSELDKLLKDSSFFKTSYVLTKADTNFLALENKLFLGIGTGAIALLLGLVFFIIKRGEKRRG